LDTIPSYEYTYFMWDVLATCYLAIPEAFKVDRNVECHVECSGASVGKTTVKRDQKVCKYCNTG
jgi:purine nucleosidase